MISQYTQILENSGLFQNISTHNVSAMITCLQPRIAHTSKNDFIVMAGDDFHELGILLKGEARVIKESAAGNRNIMRTLFPGDMFGETVVFSQVNGWPATVQATKNCTVFFLSKKRIIGECESVCPWHKQLVMNMLQITSERVLTLNKKVDYLSIKSMRGKISTFILEQHRKTGSNTLDLPLNRNELADYLNVSRPSMSREMGRLRDEGVIDYYLNSIKIKDIVALKSMAE